MRSARVRGIAVCPGARLVQGHMGWKRQQGNEMGFRVKYINTDKHILRFAKNNRTVPRNAFCLIVRSCVGYSSGFKELRESKRICIYNIKNNNTSP